MWVGVQAIVMFLPTFESEVWTLQPAPMPLHIFAISLSIIYAGPPREFLSPREKGNLAPSPNSPNNDT
jgi:hypothetical protein